MSDAYTPVLAEKIPYLQDYAYKLYCNAEVFVAVDVSVFDFIIFYANDRKSKIFYIT